MTQRELDARVASIQYTETTDLNLPAIEVAGDAFEAGVEWADGHPHWISVEDELPKINPNDSEWEYSDDVIVALKDGSIAVGRYERDNSIGEHYWVLYGVDKDLIVTHWMRIEPPASLEITEKKGKNRIWTITTNKKRIMTKEEFKARVYEALHTNEHWEQFLECVGELYLQATPRWISVEDELPEKGDIVIVMQDAYGNIHFTACEFISAMQLCDVTDFHVRSDAYLGITKKAEITLGAVTHWMPLPSIETIIK